MYRLGWGHSVVVEYSVGYSMALGSFTLLGEFQCTSPHQLLCAVSESHFGEGGWAFCAKLGFLPVLGLTWSWGLRNRRKALGANPARAN